MSCPLGRTPRARGFTVIELIVVIAILGILASVALPSLDNFSPKYRLRSAARTVGSTINYARSMSGGTGEEHAVRYDLEDQLVTIILPPGEDEPLDLDLDEREDMGPQDLPGGVKIVKVLYPDGYSDDRGYAYCTFDAYGNDGSHIVVLENEEEAQIAVIFNAILGVVDYGPGESAAFPEY